MREITCSVCAAPNVRVVADTGSLPVLCNQLCRTRSAAVGALKAEVKLGYCESCGHVQNVSFDERLVRYSSEYENSLHCSELFQSMIERLASELIERHALAGKRVVEVGCGNGEFLRQLCRDGSSQGFGFDMSYPGDLAELPSNISIQASAYGPEHRHIDPDLVCTRHVLEHIAEPVRFLGSIRQGMREGAALYVEVPNALFTLRDGGVWDIIYEHCGYFTPDSLTTALETSGFSVELMQEAFDGQFLCAHARARHQAGPASRRPPDPELRRIVTEFVCAHGSKVSAWRSSLNELSLRQRRVVAWGAGSKGNTFANIVGQSDIVPYMVDLNPRKHGMFVAGTGARIVPPEFLAQYRPDVVIVLNPNYEAEIREHLERLGVYPTIMVA